MLFRSYEKDFIDEMIPYEDFMSRVSVLRKEFTLLAKLMHQGGSNLVLKSYPADEEHITSVANALTNRRRYQDAIRLLRLNLDLHPDSADVSDRLSRNYRLSGDMKMAEQFARKAGETQVRPASPHND